MKVYLYTCRYLNDEGGGCDTKIFASFEEASEFVRSQVSVYKKETDVLKPTEEFAENFIKVHFFERGFTNNFCEFIVEEITLEEGDYASALVRQQINDELQGIGINPETKEALVNRLVETIANTELFSSFHDDVDKYLSRDEEYAFLFSDGYWD